MTNDAKFITNLLMKVRGWYSQSHYISNIELAQQLLQRYSVEDICVSIIFYKDRISNLGYLLADNCSPIKRAMRHKKQLLQQVMKHKYKQAPKEKKTLFNTVSYSPRHISRKNIFARLKNYGSEEKG